MNKFIQRNINQLKRLKTKNTEGATKATVKRIDEIIKLYTERKISNKTTAENMIKGLTSDNKRERDKAFQKYKDNIKELKERQPLNQRMAETRKRKKKNTYLVNFLLYTIRKPKNERIKPAFTVNGRAFYVESFDVRSATIEAIQFPKEVIGRRILRYLTDGDDFNGLQNPEFVDLIKMLEEDEEFKDLVQFLRDFHYDNLFDAIKITKVELVDDTGEKFNIMTENLTRTVNVSIYHRYIHTPITTNAETIKEAINKGHYIENECWINLLTDFYADTIMNERTRNRLTRDKVIEIIGRTDFSQKGASIQEMEAVFKTYGIQVRIYNFFTQLIYKYDPPKRNHHIKTLYAMVKNNHIYALNYDLKSIQQKQDCLMPSVRASTDYYLNEKEEPPKYKMIRCLNDILNLEINEEEKEIYLVPELNNLHELFFEIIKSGYEPRITFQAGIITDIRLKLDKVKYVIKTQNLIKSSPDGCIAVRDEQTYNRMNEAMFKFNKSLFNPLHKSFYNDIDIAILDETRTIAPLGIFYDKKSIPKNIIELDRCKAFTKAFIDIAKIFVFNQFDIWKVYNDTFDINKLNDLTIYYVYVEPHDLTFCDRTRIIFNKKHNIITGEILKKLPERVRPRITILYYKEPSFIHKVDYKGIVDELYNTTIDEKDKDEDKFIKKLIGNINYGLMEKGGSTDQKSIVFRNLKEAVNYQTDCGGKIHKLTHIEEEVEMGDDKRHSWTSSFETEQEAYYILNLKDKAQLKNGYRWIKEILLQYHNFSMWEAYWKLRDAGVSVYSVKTDAFTIKAEDEEKATGLLDFHNDIGGWRVSKYDEIKLPHEGYKIVENQFIKIPTYESKELEIDDEYDTDDIISKIEKVRQVMIRGLVPGTGKSYICQKMVDKGYKVLFVCPTNRLLQEFEGEAITVNKFFGISFGDTKLEPLDYSPYDVIVFDEIYFSGLSVYWKIKQFVEQNKDSKIIIATGDTLQLKPVQELTNTKEYREYADEIIDKIFEHNILLKICKRLHTDEDKQKLNNIKVDIFENKISTTKLIEKYNFGFTNDIASSKYNIAYLNRTCKNVSSEIRKLENRKGEYEVGEFLICREYTKTKLGTFNVNFKYEIVYIGGGIMKLKNVKTNTLQSLETDKVRKNFIFAWCSTCHSAQGSSINDEITIFDYNHFLVKNYPEWIWTALTRCRDLNKVKFFKYSNDTNDEFNRKCIMSYFERKVEKYKLQDRTAKRKIPRDGYVNVEWFLGNINNQCNYCGCGFHIDMVKGNVMSNITCQRKDNEMTHTLDNIVPFCCRCNCSCK